MACLRSPLQYSIVDFLKLLSRFILASTRFYIGPLFCAHCTRIIRVREIHPNPNERAPLHFMSNPLIALIKGMATVEAHNITHGTMNNL